MNAAVTFCAWLIVTEHDPVPLHAPPQPEKVLPPCGVGVSVTVVPELKLAEHPDGHEMPTGELVTRPEPLTVTVSGYWMRLNVAVTLFAAVIATTQAPFPLHAPLHPTNVEFAAGDGVSVTFVPYAKLAEHVGPQLTPEGLLETLPEPEPDSETVRTWGPVNVAVTFWGWSIDTTHAPVPEQAPPHPLNVNPI